MESGRVGGEILVDAAPTVILIRWMLCDFCNSREATIFQCTSYGWWGGDDGGGKLELPKPPPPMHMCKTCAGSVRRPEFEGKTYFESVGMPNEPSVYDMMASNWKHLGFTQEAFSFVDDAVHAAFRESAGDSQEKQQTNVSGPEIAEAFRQLALRKLGTNALSTLNGWGLHSCEDIGTIISYMVLFRMLTPNPDAEPDDFSGLYDFEAAFPTVPK